RANRRMTSFPKLAHSIAPLWHRRGPRKWRLRSGRPRKPWITLQSLQPSRGQQVRTMARLCGVLGDRAAARNALAWRQFGLVLDGTHQQIERLERMRLDKFELRKGHLECLDWVAVFHFVETVARARLRGLLPRYRGHAARIGTSIGVDRQQRVHRACDGDERPANAAGGAKIHKTFADVR